MYTSSKYNFRHKVVMAMVFLMSFQAGFPLPLSALTSGPTQPEFNEFEPVGTTQMVDLFSGDFTYNIPLFELPGPDGGYPFNLSYHSGITMDQEASWVGLGWSLNHGAITRTMRGFPDDFSGDEVKRKMDMKDNRTWQFGINGHVEVAGKKKKTTGDTKKAADDPSTGTNITLGLGLRVMHNNYKGWNMGVNFAPGLKYLSSKGNDYQGRLDFNYNTSEGATFQPSFSFGNVKKGLKSAQLSFGVNSLHGAQNLSLGFAAVRTIPKNKGKTTDSSSDPNSTKSTNIYIPTTANYTFGKSSYSPQVAMPYRGLNFTGGFEIGGTPVFMTGIGAGMELRFMKQSLKHRNVWTSAPAYGYFHLENLGEEDKFLLDFNREKEGPLYHATPNLGNPISTPDIYSVMGQGTGGVYRAYRSDVGIFTDP
ncbi:MAG: hypothetical protein AAF985_16840, partial [Bacteroidota bacterium]